jgi:hypothetical protein
MKKELWEHVVFSPDDKIKWPCPSCGQSNLTLPKENFVVKETGESERLHLKLNDWDPEWVQFHFTALFVCTNTECLETVTCLGHGSPNTHQYYNPVSEEIEDCADEFYPRFFYPPLQMFSIPKKCSLLVVQEITKSFSLFWNDAAACANKIGVAIEQIMDDKKIKRIRVVRSKRKTLSLHARINEEFRLKESEAADQLLAVKWIRNSGSHIGEITNADVLEAYEILEHALVEIYEGRAKNIKKMVKEINKARGPRRKKGV